MKRLIRQVIVSFMVLILTVSSESNAMQIVIPPLASNYDTLLQKARDFGTIRVIVGLNASFTPEGDLESGFAMQSQRMNIEQTQLNFQAQMPPMLDVISFDTIPYMAMTVTEDQLRQIIHSPQVTSITEDMILTLHLDNSAGLIGADIAHNLGHDGTEQAVAVIDTGTQNSHPTFGNRVVAEACFSTNGTFLGQTFESTCTGGMTEDFGTGSAAPCPDDFCFHGTHVSGIAAGGDATYMGIAPGANLIAVKAVSRPTTGCGFFPNPPCTPQPLLSDVLRGVEWVYSLRDTYNIAALNLSLGSQQVFERYCDGLQPSLEAAFLNLLSEEIAVIAGSGNSSSAVGLSYPACLSTTISVGAVNDSDGVASFSNSLSILDLLAPGVDIVSAIPGDTYESQQGTSMAAPFVTGAFAVLREVDPNATVDEILSALLASGVVVQDSRNNVQTARIQVDDAVDVLIAGPPMNHDIRINEIRLDSPASIELYNAEIFPVNMSGWKLELYNMEGTPALEYTFPSNYAIPAGSFKVLVNGTGSDPTVTYLGNSAVNWQASTGGTVRLGNGSFFIDFVQWGTNALLPGVGTGWTGQSPLKPSSGFTLGRDGLQTDIDDGSDWSAMTSTLGSTNIVIAPVNDNLANATVITSLPFEDVLENRNTSVETGEVTPDCTDGMTRTVWYIYTPSESVTLRIDTSQSDFDTVLALYTGTPGALTQVGCNDDIVLGQVPQSRILHSATANQTYYIQVGGYQGAFGELVVKVAQPSANDAFEGRTNIATLPYSFSEEVTDYTASGDDPAPACNDVKEHSAWFSYTPQQDQSIIVKTEGSNYDTVLSAWTGTQGSLQAVGCHDDVSFSLTLIDLTSILELNVMGGVSYHFMVSSSPFVHNPDVKLLEFQVIDKEAMTETITPTGTLTVTSTQTPITDVTPKPTGTQEPTPPTEDVTPTITVETTPDVTDEPVLPGECIQQEMPYMRPVINWLRSEEDGSTQYHVILWNNDMQLVAFDEWFNVNTICDGTNCQISPDEVLLPIGLLKGEHLLFVQAWTGDTSTDWQQVTTLRIDLPAAGLPALTVIPNHGRPTISWSHDPNAAWYQIYIGKDDGTLLYLDWHPVSELCCGDSCSLKPEIYPTAGTYHVYMQAWGPGGFSQGGVQGWSGNSFILPDAPPSMVTNLATTDENTGQPIFTWQGSQGVVWYQVWIGTLVPVTTTQTGWYLAETLRCENAEVCTFKPDVNLSNGTYDWFIQGWGPGGLTQGGDYQGWARGNAFIIDR